MKDPDVLGALGPGGAWLGLGLGLRLGREQSPVLGASGSFGSRPSSLLPGARRLRLLPGRLVLSGGHQLREGREASDVLGVQAQLLYLVP